MKCAVCRVPAFLLALLVGEVSPFSRDYVLLRLFDQVAREQRCALERASEPVDKGDFCVLYDNLVFWLTSRGIWVPPNVEFSIKFSQDSVNNKRYVLELPVAVFAGKEELLDDLLFFLALPKSVLNFLNQCDVMRAYSLIFAVEFSERSCQKVYVDYGYGMGMQSCEWLVDEPEIVAKRSYNTIDDCASVDSYVKNNLSGQRLKAYQKLLPYLEIDRSLVKNKRDAKTLCVPFKQEVTVGDVLDYLTIIVPLECTHLVVPLLSSSNNFIISWLHIARSEITCYTRIYPWYVMVVSPSRRGTFCTIV